MLVDFPPGVTNEVQISIADEGSGIREDELPLVFEPFFRSPDVREVAGVGLGLAISSRLAKALGGRITVQSTAGKGSVFTVHFPAVREMLTNTAENLRLEPFESAAGR